jgi:hypothetical protein
MNKSILDLYHDPPSSEEIMVKLKKNPRKLPMALISNLVTGNLHWTRSVLQGGTSPSVDY